MTDKDTLELDWGDEDARIDGDMIDWWHDLQRDRKLMAAADQQEAQAVMPEVTEEARLAGMAGGCAAKNEAMGNALGGRAYCPDCLKDYGSGHHCCDC